MVSFKASQTASFLAAPPERFQAVLLYGPEPGLVADRAEMLAKLIAGRAGPNAEIIRLDDASLAADPGRLAIEARTLPMFGGRKIVRLKAGQRLDVEGLAELMGEEMQCMLVVEAGNLRPNAKLRQTFERADRAAALPCYLDARDLSSQVDAELARHGLRLSADARSHLVSQLATDPALVRQEIAKLALYAGEAHAVTSEAVDAIIGDTSQAGLDALANAVAAGEAAEALRQFDRLLAAGTDAQAALIVLARHFEQLHRLSAQVEEGKAVKDVLGRVRPPLHFRQRDLFAAQLRRWSRPAAARAIDALREATRASRLRPDLDRDLVERALWTLAGQIA